MMIVAEQGFTNRHFSLYSYLNATLDELEC